MEGLFNLPPRTTKAGDTNLLKKISKTNTFKNTGVTIKGGGGLLEKIAKINAVAGKYLDKYSEEYEVCKEETKFKEYIDKCIENNIVAIDTETNSLDPITCIIAGISFYTPGTKAIYVPINHISYITSIKIENQLSVEFIKEQLFRLIKNKVKIIMFNAKFDIRVIKHQIGVTLKVYWDSYVAARLLNENEEENGLKYLHKKYCSIDEGDAFSYEALFEGIPFIYIPINIGYLYAARDAKITYELYEFQEPFLNCEEHDETNKGLDKLSSLFRKIEIPLIDVVIQMEDTGIDFDEEYSKKLSIEYNKKLEKIKEEFNEEFYKYKDLVQNYKNKQGTKNKLEEPVNIASSTQIAIFLYDILQIKPVDKKDGRGTGEPILKKMSHPVAEIILKYREVAKLLSTYIDKMPNSLNPKTNRIHASFNQNGTDTGRFSSSKPNMQNIPSHNKDIRKIFKATDGYLMISSDYSAQEPRLMAHMSKDKKMIAAYKQDKDLYSEIAAIAFNMSYEDCLEFYLDECGKKTTKTNVEGKKRRNTAKTIVLGVCYGKGIPAIAKDLNISKEKAQEIYNKILKEFPGLKQLMLDSEKMAITGGYVTTNWGRKRRLPNIQLEMYEFTYTKTNINFDPLFDNQDTNFSNEVPQNIKNKYIKLLNNCYGKEEKDKIKNMALNEGIKIKDNGGYIAEAKRQCVNSRIQGSAADQIKIAMILIGTNERLKELGFRLLLTVHDELIGECPKENIKEVAELFSKLMIMAAKELIIPSKCDITITDRWYGEELVA